MELTRRELLRALLGAAAVMPVLGACGGLPASAPGPDGGGGLPDGGGALSDGGVDGGVCVDTSADIEGPFYRADAPFQATLAGPDEPGERLFVSGTVYGPDCQTPLADVVVDVWQADAAGRYDNSDPQNPPAPGVYRLRGQMRTNAQGRYEIESVIPGRYLNGGTYRPSHVHYKVRATDRAELTTQLYFEGDPFLATDPWATPSRTIPLTRDARGARGVFDIVLA